jgi:hypothetical protein
MRTFVTLLLGKRVHIRLYQMVMMTNYDDDYNTQQHDVVRDGKQQQYHRALAVILSIPPRVLSLHY